MLLADASAFSLTPTKATTLSLRLVSFSATGNYLGEKSLVIGDLMRCGTPSNLEVGVAFGTNMEVSCSFDFNHLVTQMNSLQYQGKVYQLLVQDDTLAYFDVPVYMPASPSPIRRFFL
jgi:hypothetical protein